MVFPNLRAFSGDRAEGTADSQREEGGEAINGGGGDQEVRP